MNRFIFLSAFFLSGCGTYYQQNMLPDGNTWQVDVTHISDCDGFSSSETCIKNLKPAIETRALELCGKTAHRVFACEKKERINGGMVGIGCKVTCNPGAQIQIVNEKGSVAIPAPMSGEVIEKANRCQKKGGVWVNDSCQLSID